MTDNEIDINTPMRSQQQKDDDERDNKIDEFIENYLWSIYNLDKYILEDEKDLVTFEYIKELIEIPYITLHTLNKIVRIMSNEYEDLLILSNLKEDPTLFLNEKYQLLDIRQFSNILIKYKLYNNLDILSRCKYAIIYNYVKDKSYIVKWNYPKHNNHIDFETQSFKWSPGWCDINKCEPIKKKYSICCTKKKSKWYRYDDMKIYLHEEKTKFINNLLENITNDTSINFDKVINMNDDLIHDIFENIKDPDRKNKEVMLKTKYGKPIEENDYRVPFGDYWVSIDYKKIEEDTQNNIDEICESESHINISNDKINDLIEEYEKLEEIEFSEEQKKCVKLYFNCKLLLLQGLPGTGKTTITKCIMWILKQHEKKFVFMAPTGQAVNNMIKKFNEELIDKEKDLLYGTIHKLTLSDIKNFKDYTKNQQKFYKLYEKEKNPGLLMELTYEYLFDEISNPLEFIIIDESSMIDMRLFHKLIDDLKDYKPNILLLGDINQLPPVGSGRPFLDLVNLAKVFNNNEINYSNLPVLCELKNISRNKGHLQNIIKKLNDKKKIEKEDEREGIIQSIQIEDLTDDNIKREIDNLMDNYKFDYDKDNVTILSPQNGENKNEIDKRYKGSEVHINHLFKKTDGLKNEDETFCHNDLVIRTQNSYEEGDFRANGECGRILIENKLKKKDKNGNNIYEKKITIHYNDNTKVEIKSKDELDHFNLRYCKTVHKSQGAENEVIIIIINRNHNNLEMEDGLKLIYTAISRAKKRCFIIGHTDYFYELFNKFPSSTYYSEFMKNHYEIEE